MDGRLMQGEPASEWRGAVLDSRAVDGGELFFALPGERTDGHLHAAEAIGRGAAAAVVQRPVETSGGALIRVGDTFAALHALTRHVRRRVPRRLAAITGSVGKTTTKELLSGMLGKRFRVARNPGNLNNLYGFPVALLGIPEDTEWMVAEMGMSTPGELGRLSRLGRPDVALFTNVRPVHLEFFDGLAAIAAAKAELLEGLAEGGLVVANADDPEVMRIAGRHRGPVATYGMREPADYAATDVEPLAEAPGGTRFRLLAGGDSREVRLALHGRFNVENCLAAAACAHRLGVTLEQIARAAEEARPLARRSVLHPLPGGGTLVDDCYNSNPAALRQALRAARELPGKRHWAVLGDMLELGPEAARFHREAGAAAAAEGFSPVVGVGELARQLAAAAGAAGAEARWFGDAAAAAEALAGELRRGDVVLVKGSRGIGLEVVVDRLRGAGDGG